MVHWLCQMYCHYDGAQAKVDQALIKVNDKQTQVDDWWNGLSNAEQAKPSNKAKYETANKALDTAGNLLNGIDGALSTAETSTVQYSLEKAPKDMWNFIIGTQYQYNRHFMLRAECGFLGSSYPVYDKSSISFWIII